MAKARVGRSVKTMQVSKKFMNLCKSLSQNCLPICIKIDFQQRMLEKYRRSLDHGLEFPILHLVKGYRYISTPNQAIRIAFPVHITMRMSISNISTISTTPIRIWNVSNLESHQSVSIEKLSSIAWHDIRRSWPLSVHEDFFFQSNINSKEIQIIPAAIIADRIEPRPSFSRMEILAQRSDESSGYVPIQKAGGLPAVTEHEESVIIHKAGRPLELSYLPPAATMLAKPAFRPGQHSAESTFSERSRVDVHPLPKTSQGGGLDLNLLTEQVYQVLERKIRLEKQRRGYR
jgi:hypothetical protein